MSIFSQNWKFYGQPFRLTPEQQGDPQTTLRELFDEFKLEEIREFLAAFLEVAISTDNIIFSEPRPRSNALYAYRQIEEILEAAYILSTKPQDKII